MTTAELEIPSLISRKLVVLFIVILAAGSFLRLTGLPFRGLISWDEGHYMMESQFFDSVFHQSGEIWQALQKGDLNVSWLKEHIEGKLPVSAKPFHNLLIFLFSLPWGLRDVTGSYFSALFGILTLVLLFKMTQTFWGEQTAFFSTLTLAFSTLHIFYSRSPMPEADSIFFLLSGIYLYLKGIKLGISPQRYFLFSGILLGAAMLCNYRWLYLVMILAAVALFHAFLLKKINPSWKLSHFVWLSSILAILLMAEAPYAFFHLKSLKGLEALAPWQQWSYLESLRWFYETKPTQGNWTLNPFMLSSLLQTEGPVVLGLSLGGLYLALRQRKSLAALFVALGFAIPLIIFSLTSRGNRLVAISVILPFMAILTALACSRILERVPPVLKMPIALFLSGVLISSEIPGVASVLRLHSGWRQATQYLKDQGQPKHLSFETAVSKFYVGRDLATIPPPQASDIKIRWEQGYRYLLLDWKKYHDDNYSPLIRDIEAKLLPVEVFDHNVISPVTLGDNMKYDPKNPGLFKSIQSDPTVRKIYVYDLRDYFASNQGMAL